MRFYQYELQFRRIAPVSGEIRGANQSLNATKPAVTSSTTQLPRKNQVESIT
jgi:hypothetical protein